MLAQLRRHTLFTSICFIRNTDGEKLGENGQAGDSRTLLMLELCALSSILELCALSSILELCTLPSILELCTLYSILGL